MLGLLALAIVLAAGCVYAGLWQLDVAQRDGSKSMSDQAARPAVQLEKFITPQQTFPSDGSLRKVSVTGTYDASGQVYVSGRVLHGVNGYWVVTPLLVQSTGAQIPVVRGFVPTPTAPAPASGRQEVTVEGALAPGEAPSDGIAPGDVLTTVDLATLLDHWGGNVYNGFIFMTSESPVATVAPIQTFPPPTPADSGLNLLNAGYALQWWAFAIFAFFMWGRVVRDESRAEVEAAQQASSAERDNGTADRATVGSSTTDETRHTPTKDVHV
ncbi:cytochrome oxidase assembly protein ShyY1 [Rudaeicoccus suwonensis]|uniref:SURF1-like protein n=2 Tax=Rudaeicoccus suwonensis TaxID=657409 RepID=A0A561E8L8_9MICO|nr:cytochrome oxidase assembly protein ShyY1 [Rudaeicoccus suwonensis]